MEKVELWPVEQEDRRDVPVLYMRPDQIAGHEYWGSEPLPSKHQQPSLIAI
jgi:hypothetical protein